MLALALGKRRKSRCQLAGNKCIYKIHIKCLKYRSDVSASGALPSAEIIRYFYDRYYLYNFAGSRSSIKQTSSKYFSTMTQSRHSPCFENSNRLKLKCKVAFQGKNFAWLFVIHWLTVISYYFLLVVASQSFVPHYCLAVQRDSGNLICSSY